MAGKQLSARNVLILAMGLFVCFWIFVLGVLVGRGTSPVTFDTREFQDSLARIVNGSENEQETFEKPELEFYEVLKSPAGTTRSKSKPPGEILPAAVEGTPSDTKGGRPQPPVKKSLKARTFRLAKMVKATSSVADSPKSHSKPAPVPKKEVKKPVRDEGVYTIQIAAYKELKDAKDMMDRLRAKGFQSYRTMGRVGDGIWHRVRTGSFKDMNSAKQEIQRLGKKRFKGMIIRKE